MNQPRRYKKHVKSASLFGVGWIYLLGGLFVCLILSSSYFCESASTILMSIGSKCNVGRMTWRRDERRIMNEVDSGTLLMMMDDLGIKNISIFHTRLYKDNYFIPPSLHHSFQWNSNKATLSSCVWPHDYRISFCRSKDE
jgi:hypothetical protein